LGIIASHGVIVTGIKELVLVPLPN